MNTDLAQLSSRLGDTVMQEVSAVEVDNIVIIHKDDEFYITSNLDPQEGVNLLSKFLLQVNGTKARVMSASEKSTIYASE